MQRRSLVRLAAGGVLVTVMATWAAAHTFRLGDLLIEHPWARPTIPNRPGAVYLGPLQRGATGPLTLEFRRAGKVTVQLRIEARTGS